MEKKKLFEVLAPAGNYETLKAVIAAGADAIYLGGPAFGARAYAGNFTQEELLEALDYAHLRGRKIYLTVNTLLKNQEINAVKDYLMPYYLRGLDAVLVQDIGVLKLIHETFPDLPIHTSTQMTITGPEGVRLLQQYGVTRVVMARETSIAEMKKIHEETGIELEAFVHGAMCYCYSGQCLFSSMLGGRSGNRGRCAQPCRLPYSVCSADKKPYRKESYCLSLKDLCGLADLKELSQAGVYSLKIEGRMKSPEYASGVVSVYRRYADLAESSQEFAVTLQDRKTLTELGSRCGFSDAYYHKHNDTSMITFEKPNFQSTNPSITDTMHEKYVGLADRIPAEGKLDLHEGEPSVFQAKSLGTQVSCQGQAPSPAQKKPLAMEDVSARMKKTGDTPFAMDDLQVDMDENIFLPNGALNQLRRDALEKLKDEILKSFYRKEPKENAVGLTGCGDEAAVLQMQASKICDPDTVGAESSFESVQTRQQAAVCSAETFEQADMILKSSFVDALYLSSDLAYEDEDHMKEIEEECRSRQIGFYLLLPSVCRYRTAQKLKEELKTPLFLQADGFVVRNYEEFQLIREEVPKKDIICDHNLYSYNDTAAGALLQMGASRITMPLELNGGEIADRCNRRTEMIIYGYYPLMTTAGCVHKNTRSCDHKSQITWLKDRYQTFFPVKNCCQECYNIIYNSLPVCLFDAADRLRKAGVKTMRLSFTIENARQTESVLKLYENVLSGTYRKEQNKVLGPVTGGHYKRGVE